MRIAFATVTSAICLALIAAGLIRAREQPGQGLGLAAIFACLLVLAWVVPLGGRRRKAMRDSLRRLAQEMGATVRQAPHETILELEVHGQPATLAWGFVKWGKGQMMRESLRFEIALPAPLPRFRLINRHAAKRLVKRFAGEQRMELPSALAHEIQADAPRPDRVAQVLPAALLEAAAPLFRDAPAARPLNGDPAGWEIWCDGTRAAGVLPNHCDMDRVRAALHLLSLLVESCVESARGQGLTPPEQGSGVI